MGAAKIGGSRIAQPISGLLKFFLDAPPSALRALGSLSAQDQGQNILPLLKDPRRRRLEAITTLAPQAQGSAEALMTCSRGRKLSREKLSGC